jgi:hypothetical protein
MIDIYISIASLLILAGTVTLILFFKESAHISSFATITSGIISLIISLIFPFLLKNFDFTMIALLLSVVLMLTSILVLFIENNLSNVIFSKRTQKRDCYRHDKTECVLGKGLKNISNISNLSTIDKYDNTKNISIHGVDSQENTYNFDRGSVSTSTSKNDVLLEVGQPDTTPYYQYGQPPSLKQEDKNTNLSTGLDMELINIINNSIETLGNKEIDSLKESLENGELMDEEELRQQCEEALAQLGKDWLKQALVEEI